MNIEIDNPTLVRMLGYISIQQWTDAALQEDGVDKDLIFKLLKQVDIRYDMDLTAEVTSEMNRP